MIWKSGIRSNYAGSPFLKLGTAENERIRFGTSLVVTRNGNEKAWSSKRRDMFDVFADTGLSVLRSF